MQDDLSGAGLQHHTPGRGVYSPTAVTAVFTHRGCMEHLLIEPHDYGSYYRLTTERVENSNRLEVLLDSKRGILNLPRFHSSTFEWNLVTEVASWADVVRVHDVGYVTRLKEICYSSTQTSLNPSTRLGIKDTADPPHPLMPSDGKIAAHYAKVDQDTVVTHNSFFAALSAAQSVISAVKAIADRRARNAFCCIRPPGHHVGTFGAAQPPNSADDALFHLDTA